MRAGLIAAILLAGCIAAPAPDEAGDQVGQFVLSAAERLAFDGGPASEPHIAVRGNESAPTMVVASIVTLEGESPSEDTRFWIAIHRRAGDAPWESSLLPPSVVEPLELGPEMRFVADPVLTYGPAGELYLGGVAASGVQKGLALQMTELSVFLTRSDDDGATWAPAIFWKRGAGTLGFPVLGAGQLQDKEWVAVAPDGTVHFTWTEFIQTATFLRHVRSTDGGKTWSQEQEIGRGDPDKFLSGTTIAAPGDDRVYVAAIHNRFRSPDPLIPGVMLLFTSEDGGATFSAPSEVGPSASWQFGSGFVFASPANPGRVLVTGGTGGTSHVWMRESRDAGATWDPVVWVAKGRDGNQIYPTGWIDDAGRAHLLYYDAGWPGGERPVFAVVEGARVAFEAAPDVPPLDPGRFRRDYIGIAGIKATSWGVWVDGTEDAGTTVGLARLTAPGS